MFKISSLFIVMILLVGCSIKQPYITEYNLNIEDVPKIKLAKNHKTKTLKVLQAFSDNSFMSSNMNYIVGDHKQYSYTQSQWGITVNQMVTLNLTNMLNQLDIFKSVQNYKSITKNDYILQSSILDFKQYFSEDLKSSYVKVTLNLSLIEANSNKIIKSKTFSTTTKTKTQDAYGGVQAFDTAFLKVLEDIAQWI